MVETMMPGGLDSMTPELKQAQAKLMKILDASRFATSSKTLFEHVVAVVDFLVRNYPNQAIEKFEEVSYLIKHGDKEKLKQFLLTQDCRDYARPDKVLARHTAKHFEKASKFFPVSRISC